MSASNNSTNVSNGIHTIIYNTTMADNFTFGNTDYILLILMLLLSSAIGVYFGFFSKLKNTTDEYLMGGKNLKTIPVAISLITSQISALSMLTVPAENYSFGICYIFAPISLLLVIPILNHIILPVFFKNNLTNCYQYLELRFNKPTRQLVTASFILNTLLLMPLLMFLPSLAFSQVTGINIHLINVIISAICVFYTILGGIKAVVWTDVLQGGIVLFFTILLVILGIAKVGGFFKVFEIAAEGGRLDISLSLDPRARTTIWNTLMSATLLWTSHIGLSQVCVQRVVSLPSIHHARRAIYIACIGTFIILMFSAFTGVVMYAHYHGCDPLSLGQVSQPDKLVPHFVQDIMGHMNGMPGVFISCVFSAALSSLSAMLNCLAGVVYFDYMKPFIKHTDARANFIMKVFIAVAGLYCVVGGLIVEHFSSILQSIITVVSITTGAIAGVFMLGMFVPRVNAKVALTSVLISIFVMLWIVVMNQLRFKEGIIRYDVLPTKTDRCQAQTLNVFLETLTTTQSTPLESQTTGNRQITTAFESNRSFSIFEVSFFWFSLIGAAIVWLVAIPLSYVWKRDDDDDDDKLDHKLYATFVWKFIKSDIIEMESIPMMKRNEKILIVEKNTPNILNN